MTYRKATYDEYCEASRFAKFRYRFGVYIQTIAAILLILLFIYTVVNIEEMKTHPVEYAEEKQGVICTYPLEHIRDINEIENIIIYPNYNGS